MPITSTSLRRDSATPLYLQLYSSLRAQIQRGDLKPGDRVPTEAELVEVFGVSRITVRSALKQLQQEGYFERHRGLGSFVKAGWNDRPACLNSFTEQCIQSGRTPTTRLLSLNVVPGNEIAGADSPFAPTEEVVAIGRLRLIDDVPAGIVRSFVPHRFIPGIRRAHFRSRGREQSLLHLLEHRFHLVLDKGTETTCAAHVEGDDAAYLSITPGSPGVLKTCVVKNVLGDPVLYEEALWCTPQTVPVERRAVAGD